MNHISAIGIHPDNQVSDFIEYSNIRNDLSKLNDQQLVKKVFFQKLVEIIHTPIFVIDTEALERMLEMARQIKSI